MRRSCHRPALPARRPGDTAQVGDSWRADASAVPPAGSHELALSLRWHRYGDQLRGEVVAENIGDRVCRLGNKPRLAPLGQDGKPLGVDQIITLELRIPPFVILRPGQRAAAAVSWSGWRGPPASGRVLLAWDGGSTVVDARGPAQPACPKDGSGNLSSGWFTLID
jgi:hypothetical protein